VLHGTFHRFSTRWKLKFINRSNEVLLLLEVTEDEAAHKRGKRAQLTAALSTRPCESGTVWTWNGGYRPLVNDTHSSAVQRHKCTHPPSLASRAK
jgi:hypothetical protein